MSESLADQLREAYEKHEAENLATEPVGESEETPPVAEDSGQEETSTEPTAEPIAKPTTETGAESGGEAESDGSEDNQSDGSEDNQSEPAEPVTVEPAAEPEPEVTLAPAAWRGSAKQHWGELPPEVQQEVLRREKETNQVLNDTAQARQFTDRFMEVAAPYQGMFQSERVDALSAAQSLFQTAAELRSGSAEQKAGIVYRLMQQHGIDAQILDKMLVGEMQAPGMAAAPGQPPLDPSVQAMIDQRMQPMQQLVSRLLDNETAQSEALAQQMDAEIDTFAADPAHVFFADVRPVMVELFEAADRAGRPLDLDTAYKTAVSMDPELSELQAKRDAALRANNGQSASARRERAAASLKPTAVPDNSPSKPMDRESQLAEAWDLHSR